MFIFFFLQINLREIGLTMDSQVSEGHLSIYFHSSTGFQLEVLEGFCSFDNRGMIGRHGNVYTDDSAEFLGSWR